MKKEKKENKKQYVYYKGRRYEIFTRTSMDKYWVAMVNIDFHEYDEYKDYAYGRSENHAIQCLKNMFYQARIDKAVSLYCDGKKEIYDVGEYTIETEQETNGRVIAEILEMPGAIAYGQTKKEAKNNVLKLVKTLKNDKMKTC